MVAYDLVVIGAGPGGYIAALAAAEAGLKTACIDKNSALGGTCLNVGCIPSKALLQVTHLLQYVSKQGETLGLTKTAVDFSQMMRHKELTVTALNEVVRQLLEAKKVDVFTGTARLVDSHTVAVDGKKIEGKNILLAAGSEPIPLPDMPFDETLILSSTGALALKKPPKTLAVIGAGVIGVELASVYARLGTKVVILELLEHICGGLDATLHAHLLRSLTAQGIKIFLGVNELKLIKGTGQVEVTARVQDKQQQWVVDKVLVAIGRRPNSQALGLDALKIAKTARGHVIVDSHLRTNQPHIFAIGDLIEGPMLAHRATAEGEQIPALIAGKTSSLDYITVPNVIYTFPEIATVGLTEEEAKAYGRKIYTGTALFKGNGRARVNCELEGVVKVVMDAKSGALLGMHLMGPGVSEMICLGSLSLRLRAKVADIAELPFAHPTLSEVIHEACQKCYRSSLK